MHGFWRRLKALDPSLTPIGTPQYLRWQNTLFN
jgi:hypothetical protein